jgi:archaellum biogenesis ATPase FlaH
MWTVVKQERLVREGITRLKSAADEDVGIALTSTAQMRIRVWGVAAVPGAATSMTMVIPYNIFLTAQSVVQNQNMMAGQ